MRAELALYARAEHAEGPSWDRQSARLWWVDITGQRVHCFDPVSGSDCSWNVGLDTGAVILTTSGAVLLAVPNGLVKFDPDTGTVGELIAVEAELPGNRLNDAKVDSTGRLWVGTMPYDKRLGVGGLYSIDSKREVVSQMRDLTIVNGPAFDDALSRLYVADTSAGLVYAADFDLHSGTIGARRVFVDLSGAGYWPDGMTVDNEGRLWVAVGCDSSVHCYSPDAALLERIELPVSNPTSVCFGGEQGSTLFITTSWYDISHAARLEQPLAGSIFTAQPGAVGAPAYRYADQVKARG